jgi:IS5 family transposase
LPTSKNPSGSKPWFNNEGKIALQFLKIYAGCSDEKLLENINGNWMMQLFCGIRLKENEEIKDKDLIWKTRKLVSEHLEVEKFQAILIENWKDDMENTQMGMSDATCYESYIKFPTDVKLLWDGVEWLDEQIRYYAKALGLRHPRSKVKEQSIKQLNYAKKRRKSKKLIRRRQRQLLYLVNKLLLQFDNLVAHWQEELRLGIGNLFLFLPAHLDKYFTICKIYEQQRFHYDNPKQSVPNRIVSLYKPYLRPIVRGKESNGGKRVEFGTKVNTWQVDGLNFIEHYSFSAFHEGNRLQQGIIFHQRHFGKLRQLGADAIYATNKNRKFCKRFNIATCFKPKGRRTLKPLLRKQEDQARRTIGKIRSTALEGSTLPDDFFLPRILTNYSKRLYAKISSKNLTKSDFAKFHETRAFLTSFRGISQNLYL